MEKYKNSNHPYYSTGPKNKIDMDSFPYTRFYRGIPESNIPIIFDRETGWKERRDYCYNIPQLTEGEDYYPNHCFQGAPSTTYPCYSQYLRKYADKREMDLLLFKKNVLEYR